MAISSSYCTHRDLKDVFPQIDEYDTKTPLYGWTSLGAGVYISYDTGLITQLYVDGQEQNHDPGRGTSGTSIWGVETEGALIAEPNPGKDTYNIITYNASFGSGSEDDLKAGSYIILGSSAQEIVFVQSVDTSSNRLTVLRGAIGTESKIAAWADGTDMLEYLRVNSANTWYYDSYLDHALLYSSTDPNDLLVESGEDFSTLITRIIKNASRYFDSRVDARLPRDQWKDKEGNYDYLVVRSTALIAAYFLVNGREPGNPISEQLFEEVNFNLERINTGQVKLSYQVSSDASKGILREVVSPQAANPLHIVDTRGDYHGTYDLLKIVINTAGAIGTAKFDVFGADADSLKATKIVSADTINGRYQTVAGGLQIRFAGKDDSSVATLGGTPDEWELEVFGKYESLDESPNSGANTRMTRHRRR